MMTVRTTSRAKRTMARRATSIAEKEDDQKDHINSRKGV